MWIVGFSSPPKQYTLLPTTVSACELLGPGPAPFWPTWLTISRLNLYWSRRSKMILKVKFYFTLTHVFSATGLILAISFFSLLFVDDTLLLVLCVVYIGKYGITSPQVEIQRFRKTRSIVCQIKWRYVTIYNTNSFFYCKKEKKLVTQV